MVSTQPDVGTLLKNAVRRREKLLGLIAGFLGVWSMVAGLIITLGTDAFVSREVGWTAGPAFLGAGAILVVFSILLCHKLGYLSFRLPDKNPEPTMTPTAEQGVGEEGTQGAGEEGTQGTQGTQGTEGTQEDAPAVLVL